MEKGEVIKIMPTPTKQIFVIDGYRIYAHSYDEAYQHYLRIVRF